MSNAPPARSVQRADTIVEADAAALSRELKALRERVFPPNSKKRLRTFTSGEAARLIGVTDSYLRQLALAGEGPVPEQLAGGRRAYTLDQINALRRHLQRHSGKRYLPNRTGSEALQVMAVVNFKGGSGKTTTATHLAQHLAFQGYRVLAVDLDPQASMTALFGLQPEFDVPPGNTLYGALRYDEVRVPLQTVIQRTYVDGLDLVPAHLELQEFEHTTPKVLADRANPPGGPFFARLTTALASVEERYDLVVIDCPPQLGFLTLAALCAATGLIVTVHPQMLDVASMSQFLAMAADLMAVVGESGADLSFDFIRYLVTRYEPQDAPQTQIVGFLRTLFGERVMTNPMVKSTAISDAGLTKQTLYEVKREEFSRATYDRAMEALEAVNGEIEALIRKAWGRG